MSIEIKLTKGYAAVIDDCDYDLIKRCNWYASVHSGIPYAYTFMNGRNIGMHRLLMGVTDPDILVDHEDNDSLNNMRKNLRIASKIENGRNRRSQKQSASKYMGVSIHEAKKTLKSGKIAVYKYWSVYLMINNKNTYLGSKKDEIEAAKLHDEHALKHYGQFANLNFKRNEPIF